MPVDYEPSKEGPTVHQRRPEYIRNDEWIKDFLRGGKVAHIATLWDKQPFITATTYYYDEAKNRIIFHSNITGRVRANIEKHPQVCAEVSELGKLLPSNTALEFSLQYRSVNVFGNANIIGSLEEQREAMHHVIAKYFPELQNGKDYRPATDKELKRTSVYEIRIEAWSGKENWKERAEQSNEWPTLEAKFLQHVEMRSPT